MREGRVLRLDRIWVGQYLYQLEALQFLLIEVWSVVVVQWLTERLNDLDILISAPAVAFLLQLGDFSNEVILVTSQVPVFINFILLHKIS